MLLFLVHPTKKHLRGLNGLGDAGMCELYICVCNGFFVLFAELDGIECLLACRVDAFDEHHLVVRALDDGGIYLFDIFGRGDTSAIDGEDDESVLDSGGLDRAVLDG